MQFYFNSKKTGSYIFEYLTEMQKFVSVHPVITKIDMYGDNNYLVHETFKFAGILFSFTYPVKVDAQHLENTVTMKATVMRLIKIKMTFTINAGKDATIIEENISIQSPFPVKSIMQNVFKTQHQKLFKNIEMTDE